MFVKDTFYSDDLYNAICKKMRPSCFTNAMVGLITFMLQTTFLMMPIIQTLLEDHFNHQNDDTNHTWAKYKYLLFVGIMCLQRVIQWFEKNEIRERIEKLESKLITQNTILNNTVSIVANHDTTLNDTVSIVANHDTKFANHETKFANHDTKIFELQEDKRIINSFDNELKQAAKISKSPSEIIEEDRSKAYDAKYTIIH